jgi:DedD protein
VGPLLPRNRHRLGKRPTQLPLLLFVAFLCLSSFLVGVWVGRGQQAVAAIEVSSPQRMVVEKSPPPVVDPPKPHSGTEGLTFFESLPKGEQPPLGSGINLPPATQPPKQEAVQPAPKAIAEQTALAAAPKKVPPPPVTAGAAGSYLVQAASFAKEEEAQALQARLSKKNYPVFVQSAQLGERGTWYRVMIGPLENTSAAEGIATRLQGEEKLSAMIRKY